MLAVCSIKIRLKQKIPNLKLAHLNDFTANATLEGRKVIFKRGLVLLMLLSFGVISHV